MVWTLYFKVHGFVFKYTLQVQLEYDPLETAEKCQVESTQDI